MSNVTIMCRIARGRKGAPATATVCRAENSTIEIVEVIEAPTSKEARRLGRLAVRKHVRIANLLS